MCNCGASRMAARQALLKPTTNAQQTASPTEFKAASPPTPKNNPLTHIPAAYSRTGASLTVKPVEEGAIQQPIPSPTRAPVNKRAIRANLLRAGVTPQRANAQAALASAQAARQTAAAPAPTQRYSVPSSRYVAHPQPQRPGGPLLMNTRITGSMRGSRFEKLKTFQIMTRRRARGTGF